jgi:predicted PurR-regulated permease PerM
MDNLRKMNQVLLFIALLFAFLYFGSPFLIPFVFGVFFTTLITPLGRFFENKLKLNRVLASLVSTLILFIAAGSILFLLIYQINQFVSDFTVMNEKIQSFINDLKAQIASITNIPESKQDELWAERSQEIMGAVESYVTGFFGSIFSTFGNFLIMLIYVFLLLLYRKKFVEFAMMYSENKDKSEVKEVLRKTSGIAYQYLLGRFKVMGILGVLYLITFLIFDLPYAILLTLFGSLITIIPYLGPLLSGLLPVLIAAIFFDDLKKVVIFAIVVVIIQLVESYVFEPLIMGKQIQLNPLVVIIMIIIGGLVWGLAGMILFVPIFAMFKIISGHISALKPVGFLIGDSDEAKPKMDKK